MRALFPIALSGLLMNGNALAAQLNLKIEIPRLNVAEYHRPYVAIWLERPDQSTAANLAVWYDYDKKNNEGNKWLKDLRQWWRHAGRDLQMPVDGLSGATRPVGTHQMSFSGDQAPLAQLPPGEYQLVIEAAREVGGRELLRMPVQWPPRSAQSLQIKGEHELGAVHVDLKP
jgi:hypothetical protein